MTELLQRTANEEQVRFDKSFRHLAGFSFTKYELLGRSCDHGPLNQAQSVQCSALGTAAIFNASTHLLGRLLCISRYVPPHYTVDIHWSVPCL